MHYIFLQKLDNLLLSKMKMVNIPFVAFDDDVNYDYFGTCVFDSSFKVKISNVSCKYRGNNNSSLFSSNSKFQIARIAF